MGEVLLQREHYAALDGLRGFAAISVLLYHIGHWLHAPLLATNSGLAVDFFFCLSGFVLALAYDHRFRAGLSTFQFMRNRLIRLMPLTVLGTIISAIYVLVRASMFKNPISSYELALATFLGLINVPFLTASSSLGGPQVFPLNGPQYSLFLEVVINFLWSALRPFNQLWLSLGIFIACLATLPFVGLGGDEAATVWFGLPRVGASFFAGVAVFHVNRAKKRQAEFQRVFWFIAALMGLFFYYPYPLSFPLELIWIALLSPLVVYTGSQIRLSGKIRSVALLGGELSYPIYVLHYPLFCWVNGSYQALTKQQDVVFEGPLILVFVLIGGFLTLKIYDKPFRKWLDRCAAL